MRFVGIDPATDTGFVAIGLDGKLIGWREHKARGETAATRINNNLDNIYKLLKRDDIVCIEGFAMEAKFDTNKVSSGHGWGVRLATDRKVGRFESATPNQLKKFANVKEHVGEVGKKRRLSTNEVKELVQLSVEYHWGNKPPTYNIADAYVLARISEAMWRIKNGQRKLTDYPSYQAEVLDALLHPEKLKQEKKLAKERKKARNAKPQAYTGQSTLF